MTEEEKYTFDIQGYLHLEGVLPSEQLAEMNAWLDEKAAEGMAWGGGGSLLTWGPAFRALLDQPRVLPLLTEILGGGLRLDHDYAIISQPGAGGFGLHGGGVPYDPSQYYHVSEGRIFSGLTVVSYALADVPPGAGGLACIPGSHKAQFRCPDDLIQFRRSSPLVRQVPMKAGDCVIFTEALTHGTFPWTAPHERRSLFLKYAPGHMSWARRYYLSGEGNDAVQALAEDMTDAQRALLLPPSADGHQEPAR